MYSWPIYVVAEKPLKKGWKKYFSKFMIVAAILGQAYLAIQVYRSYHTKNVSGISIYSYFALTLGHILWVFYTLKVTEKTDVPVLIGSLLGLTLSVVMIIALFLYGGDDLWDL